MKIIINESKIDLMNKDARERIRAIQEKSLRPIVPSIHAAVSPKVCNRCGDTFWEPDQSANIFCRKSTCGKTDEKTDAIGIGF